MNRPAPASIALISNPNSGHNSDQFDKIRTLVAAHPHINHIVTQSEEHIPAALKALADQGVDVLAINGGDGTASAILGAMLENAVLSPPPKIVLLPGGTANMNAGDVGVKGKLLKAVTRFCDWSDTAGSHTNTVVERRLLRLKYDNRTYYGMFLGTGAVMQGTEYAHEKIHSRGLRDEFSLALGTIRTVWGVLRNDPLFNQHVAIELQLDDETTARSHDTLILAASTLHRLFFGMQPFWGSGSGPLRLTVIDQHCSRFLRTFISIMRGRPNKNAVPQSGYFSHNSHRMALQLKASINLDGEIIEVDGPVTVDTTTGMQFLRL